MEPASQKYRAQTIDGSKQRDSNSRMHQKELDMTCLTYGRASVAQNTNRIDSNAMSGIGLRYTSQKRRLTDEEQKHIGRTRPRIAIDRRRTQKLFFTQIIPATERTKQLKIKRSMLNINKDIK